MTMPLQDTILQGLGSLCRLSTGVRFGQLVAHLGFLAEDLCGRNLWDIEDEELLRVIEKHHAELSRRQASVA